MRHENRATGSDPAAIRVLPPERHSPPPPPPAPPPGDSRPKGSRARIALAIGAGVIVLGAVATSGDGNDGTPRPEPTPTTAASFAPSQPAEADPQAIVSAQRSTYATWDVATIEGVDTIVDVTSVAGRITVLAGSAGESRVLTSASGSTWRIANRLDPSMEEATFLELFPHGDELVAIGVGSRGLTVWTSSNGVSWDATPLEGEGFPHQMAAASNGDTAIVALATAEGMRLWATSPDAAEWRSVAPAPALAAMTDIRAATAWEESFYVAGLRCDDGECLPTILRSDNVTDWEFVGGDDPQPAPAIDASPGVVTHLATTPDGLLAFGQLFEETYERTVVWMSSDGRRFTRAPTDVTLVPPPTVLRLSSIEGGEKPTARLVAGRVVYDLFDGDTLTTNQGPIAVDIGAEAVQLSWAGGVHVLEPGDSAVIGSRLRVLDVDTEGRRVVAVGIDFSEGPPRAVAWVSTDAGITWERIELPSGSGAEATHVSVRGGSIAVLGGSANGAQAWFGRWDTERASFLGERTTRRFLDAVTTGDSSDVLGLLSTAAPGAVRSLPTLSPIDLSRRWYGPDGETDLGAVLGTLDYLEAMESSVDLGECRSTVRITEVDSVTVTCDFASTSLMMSVLDVEDTEGSVRVTLDDEAIIAVQVIEDPSAPLWHLLGRWTEQARPDGFESLWDTTLPHDPVLSPQLTAESAAVHLAIAEDMAKQLLLPGATTVGDSPLGSIEWSWIEAPFGEGTGMGGLVQSGGDLYATTYRTLGSGAPLVWHSTDGMAWSPIPSPPADWLFRPHEFAGGVLVAGEERGRTAIWHLRDGEWTEVDIDRPDRTVGSGLDILAVHDDSAIVRTWAWDDNGDLVDQRVGIVHADLTYENVTLPAELVGDDGMFQTLLPTPTDDGLVILSHAYTETPSVWRSRDLQTWEQVGEIPGLEQASFSAFADRNGRFIAVAWRENEVCEETVEGVMCRTPVEVWTSSDGSSFAPASSMQPTGAITLGMGPLGAIAVEMPTFTESGIVQPLALHFSRDASEWVRLAEPMPVEPAAGWMWVSHVAVTADRFIVGVELDRSRDGSQPVSTLLVGRVVDS